MNTKDRKAHMEELDKRYMLLAIQTANNSPDPYMKVGAVGVRNHREGVVAFGFNDIPELSHNHPIWLDRDARRPLVVHAETMMCAMVSKNSIDTVYITLFPCVHCMTQLVAQGVTRIVYKDLYDKDKPALDVAKHYGIAVKKYEEVTQAE